MKTASHLFLKRIQRAGAMILIAVAIGFGAAVLGLGLVFGPWLALIGLALMVASAAGYAAESQRN